MQQKWAVLVETLSAVGTLSQIAQQTPIPPHISLTTEVTRALTSRHRVARVVLWQPELPDLVGLRLVMAPEGRDIQLPKTRNTCPCDSLPTSSSETAEPSLLN